MTATAMRHAKHILALLTCLAISALAFAQDAPATQPARAVTAHRLGELLVVAQRDGVIIIDGTLEASMDYARVEVRLRDGEKILTAESADILGIQNFRDINDLNDMLDGKQKKRPRDDKYIAFLDTGASANVLSKATAARFGVEAVAGAVYHEVGLHGQTAMGVSKPYEYAIRGAGAPNGEMRVVERAGAFQISTADGNPLTEVVMGEINIIGMPAIKKFVVELHPGGGTGGLTAKELENLDVTDLDKPEMMAKLEAAEAGPTVTLHEAGFNIGATDVIVALVFKNFSPRKNPKDKPPLPDLSDNPTAIVKTQNADKTYAGSWLLDTGAPANLISTKQAQALGLYNKEGKPVREPDFELPLGGIGGKVEPVPGFRIDHLIIPCADGRSLDYRNAYVLVNDIAVTLDSGETVTLDGVLGTGLWFPTVAGVASGFPTNAAPSAFSTIWIDGPGKRLMLKLQPPPATTAPATKR
jgi:hypothetical protein